MVFSQKTRLGIDVGLRSQGNDVDDSIWSWRGSISAQTSRAKSASSIVPTVQGLRDSTLQNEDGCGEIQDGDIEGCGIETK